VKNTSSAATKPHLHELFLDIERANVGFKHWHPVSVTQNGDTLCGQGELGGVWEWTSTVLEAHDGFKAMPDYPGYTGNAKHTDPNIPREPLANMRQLTSLTVSTTSF
jgi:L-histidine Nalpha-methyltransferase / hercynylcysteine S-oxide synthase